MFLHQILIALNVLQSNHEQTQKKNGDYLLICIKMCFVPFGHKNAGLVLPKQHKLCQQRLRALFVNRCKLSFSEMGWLANFCINIYTQTFPLYVRTIVTKTCAM